MLGEVGLLFGDRGVVAVGDNGGLVGILAKLRLAFDLYVVCELDAFSFDSRALRGWAVGAHHWVSGGACSVWG